MLQPIQIQNLSLIFSNKICFEDITMQVHYGSRIAIIGRNGCGKTSLLKIIKGLQAASCGHIRLPQGAQVAYVPQVIESCDDLSGSERLHAALTDAIAQHPDILLLDEPTNHLDRRNVKSLMRMLNKFAGILIVATHDVALIENCLDTIWHIDNSNVTEFTGNYCDYMAQKYQERALIEKKIAALNMQQKGMHNALMSEQQRAKKSKQYGKKKRAGDKLALRAGAQQGQTTQGKKSQAIADAKQKLVDELQALRLPKAIEHKFGIAAKDIRDREILSIRGGSIGYDAKLVLLKDINLDVNATGKIAILGDNASGKATLLKAILGNANIVRQGNWHVPKVQDIGYLDQHYATLNGADSVYDSVANLVPSWNHIEVRRHLNDFLFSDNAAVEARVTSLSGGERVRLCLAKIAAKMPSLLILDEITNNLDLATREHVIQVLKDYPGAIICVSHDVSFLNSIGIQRIYSIANATIAGKWT